MNQLTEILRRVQAAGVEFSLIGGFAAKQHGVTYVTEDVDICARFTFDNLKKIESSVQDLHPRHRLTANRLPLELTEYLASTLKNLYLQTDIGVLDCLSEVAGVGDFDAVLKESELTEFPFGPCYVITIPALIKAKEAVGRHHDILTVKQLRAIYENRQQKARQTFLPL